MKSTYNESTDTLESGLYKSTATGNIFLYNAEEDCAMLVFSTGAYEISEVYDSRLKNIHGLEKFNGIVTLKN